MECVYRVESRFPAHACGLYLEHNTHRDVYESIEQAVANEDEIDSWVSPDERKKALATGELWVLQCYPNTPIGFYRRTASSLDAVLPKAGA